MIFNLLSLFLSLQNNKCVLCGFTASVCYTLRTVRVNIERETIVYHDINTKTCKKLEQIVDIRNAKQILSPTKQSQRAAISSDQDKHTAVTFLYCCSNCPHNSIQMSSTNWVI